MKKVLTRRKKKKFKTIIYLIITGDVIDEELATDGPVPWCRRDQLTFIAEQVSHHPPSIIIKT